MGCGASKAASASGGGDSTEEVQVISSSITQIRDVAPHEVADTGAPPRRREDIIRRNLFFQAGAGQHLSIPGVIPDPELGPEYSARKGESLIKMHPPRKPQRLGPGLEALVKKNVTIQESESEADVLEVIAQEIGSNDFLQVLGKNV